MRPIARSTYIVLLFTLSAGCAADRLQREGVQAFRQGAYEEAIASLDEAVKKDPSNLELRLELRTLRETAVQQLIAVADRARGGGDDDGAARTYRRVLAIEPSNDRALHGLEAVDADRRHAARIAKAAQLLAAKKLDAAETEVRAVLAEDPGYDSANALLSKIDLARGPMGTIPRLKTRDERPVTLQFRDAPTKVVFEALARQTGLNFVFDKDVKADAKTTIFVNQVPVEQAIDLILVQGQLARQVLSDNVVLIYPDTPAKQKDYRDEIVHAFYLTNAAPKDVESLLKTVLGVKTLFVDERSGTVVMRDTPEHVRMAEKLVASLDVAEPEVIMEVEVLEVSHSLAQQLGINYPSNVSLSATRPNNSTGTSTASGSAGGLVLSDLAKQSANTLALSAIGISVDLLKTIGDTNVLSSPRIRARNKEKAKILVGNRLPVVTSGTSATVGGAFSTSNVQYIDVGLTLEVQPTIHNDGNVAIKVSLEVSSIVKQINVPIGNGGTTLAYQIGTRNASTLLELKDGETQVLAGLIQDSDQRSMAGIPGLSDLPLLGRLFGSNGKNRDKSEVVLSITPRIVRTQPRPSSETTEFWYGSESQIRSAPLGGGGSEGSTPVPPGIPPPGVPPQAPPGAASPAPGGVSFAPGSAVESAPGPPPPSGPRPLPSRIDSAARPPPPPPPAPDANTAPGGKSGDASTPPATTGASPAGAASAAAPLQGAKAGNSGGPANPATPGDAASGGGAEQAKATPGTKSVDATMADASDGGGGAHFGAADGRPRVTVEGPETAKVGEEVSVSVKLASTSPLGRIRTQVGFDASALQLVSAEPGDLASSAENPKIETKPGGVQLDLAGGDGAPVSGGGALLDLRFRVVAARPISIATQVVLIGEDGVAVAATQSTPLKIAVSP